MNWYEIDNIAGIDTPALVVYKDRVAQNIHTAIRMIGNIDLLRPHVKTNKMAEVCAMMMDAGIDKFKCATIAEAEMLAMTGAKDVLLAYQPVGPKANRLLALTKAYPATHFSCLLDDKNAAAQLSAVFSGAGKTIAVYIDLNTGMNRSGILPSGAPELFDYINTLPGITTEGIHAYDGHLRDQDIQVRQQESDAAFQQVAQLLSELQKKAKGPLKIVAGGSPTFPTHVKRNVECSPGTFVFWDWGYAQQLPDEPFEYAALVVSRIISIVDKTTMTCDLGHKSVAAENPLPRVYFLNAPDLVPVGQSEEHLVLKTPDSSIYKVGDVLYGAPVHICPTVALYDQASVIEGNKAAGVWNVIARKRMISI